jgi:[ribosomal protein S5]-alanine N-acetyltransferase
MTGFTTTRLCATPVSVADWPFFCRLWSDERVARTLGGVRDRHQVQSALAQAMTHWARHGFGRWLLRRDGEPVGTVKLARCTVAGQQEVELGYALVPEVWGQGHATEAGAGALAFAGENARLESVVAFALVSNEGSFAVMRRLGFTYERELDLPAGSHCLYRRQLSYKGE